MYDTTYGYDPANGRFQSVAGPGLPDGGAVYYYVPDSDLIDRLEFQDDQGAVLASATRSYEPRRDVITAVENNWDTTTVSRYAYDYDALARRTSVVRTGEAFANTVGDHLDLYGYNARNELTSATVFEGTDPTVPGTAITDRNRMYDYDPIGNRQSYAQGAAAPTTYTTNNVNQYPATADPAESFLYDKDGNLTEDGDFLYSWDFENRLESVVPKSPGPGDVLLMFEYDYEMRRVRKVAYPWDDALGDWSTTPSQDIRFVYDGWNLLLELDGRDLTDGAGGGPDGQPDNAIIRKYTWGLDLSGTLHGAGGIGGLLSVEDANATPTIPSDDLRYLYLYDANGNVGQLADLADGSLDATYEFAPFGTNMIDPENASQTGPYASTNRFRFSTKYLDAEAGWSYYGYRYLDSLMGRWTSRDPIEERGGENLYVFVQNAAPGYVDSNGLVPFPPPRPPLPPHTDCGIEIHQSPLCLIGGLGGGRWGHTWITWGSGGWGETSECPDNYINDPKHQCQKDFVNNKWAVRKTLYGSIFDRMKTCANADCEDVKSCLRRYARLMNEHFHLCALLDSCPNNYHCRVFYKEALNKCCLQRSTLFFVDIFVPIRYCCSRCSQGRDIRE